MMFGPRGADEACPAASSTRPQEFGVNFIDSADVYNSGVSEQIVGPPLSHHHRNCWIGRGPRFGSRFGPGPNEWADSPRVTGIMHSAQDERANGFQKSDSIDIYYLHKEGSYDTRSRKNHRGDR